MVFTIVLALIGLSTGMWHLIAFPGIALGGGEGFFSPAAYGSSLWKGNGL